MWQQNRRKLVKWGEKNNAVYFYLLASLQSFRFALNKTCWRAIHTNDLNRSLSRREVDGMTPLFIPIFAKQHLDSVCHSQIVPKVRMNWPKSANVGFPFFVRYLAHNTAHMANQGRRLLIIHCQRVCARISAMLRELWVACKWVKIETLSHCAAIYAGLVGWLAWERHSFFMCRAEWS